MMDCREFQDLAVELAAGRMESEQQEHAARDHAGQCLECNKRLHAEARLAVRLAVLKSEEESIEAPYYLQAQLLSDFQKLHAPAPPMRREPKPIREPQPISQSKLAWWSIAAAVAAVALAVWANSPGDTRREPLTAHAPSRVSEAAEAVVPQLPPLETPAVQQQHEQPQRDLQAKPVRRVSDRTRFAKAQNEQPATTVPAAAQYPSAAQTSDAPAAQKQEFVTEFVPLTVAGQMARPADVRLVRVKLPSTALAYFGLPAPPEEPTVEADIVMGNDGMARALRFVRPAMAMAGYADSRNSRELRD